MEEREQSPGLRAFDVGALVVLQDSPDSLVMITALRSRLHRQGNGKMFTNEPGGLCWPCIACSLSSMSLLVIAGVQCGEYMMTFTVVSVC